MKRLIKKVLQFSHLWGLIVRVRVFRKKCVDEKVYKKRVEEVSKQVNSIIRNASKTTNKLVYIFQHSYYTKDGKQYISGGGERYATDLGELIKNIGYYPVLVQLGVEYSNKPWSLKHGELLVIGANIKPNLFNRVLESLIEPCLAIYSGYVDFGESFFSPSIMISHGITWDNPLIDVDTKKILDILKPADQLVSVDTNTINWLRSTFANYFTTHRIEMKYIPNYVDMEVYKGKKSDKNSDEVKIIFPRRLSPERGVWLTLKVLPLILEKYKNVSFEFIGFIHTPDIERVLHKQMEEYPGRITHRFVDSDKMNQVYADADITIIPTLYSEGTSLSCIEAMASGNLVIATNVGGLPNLIINDFNGILINPCAEELLSAIDKAVSDKIYAYRLRENAIKVSEQFSKAKWNERWEKVLRKVLDEQFNYERLGINY